MKLNVQPKSILFLLYVNFSYKKSPNSIKYLNSSSTIHLLDSPTESKSSGHYSFSSFPYLSYLTAEMLGLSAILAQVLKTQFLTNQSLQYLLLWHCNETIRERQYYQKRRQRVSSISWKCWVKVAKQLFSCS